MTYHYSFLNVLFIIFFSEGGRLEKELRYVSETLGVGAGATHQLIIQTPSEDSRHASILTSDALLTHLVPVL